MFEDKRNIAILALGVLLAAALGAFVYFYVGNNSLSGELNAREDRLRSIEEKEKRIDKWKNDRGSGSSQSVDLTSRFLDPEQLYTVFASQLESAVQSYAVQSSPPIIGNEKNDKDDYYEQRVEINLKTDYSRLVGLFERLENFNWILRAASIDIDADYSNQSRPFVNARITLFGYIIKNEESDKQK